VSSDGRQVDKLAYLAVSGTLLLPYIHKYNTKAMANSGSPSAVPNM
jgi:hypothetical protein